MPRKRKSAKPRLRRVSVRAEARSEPDWDKFAWALLQYARLLSANETNTNKTKQQRPKP